MPSPDDSAQKSGWLLEVFVFFFSFATTWQCPNHFQIVLTFTFSQSQVQGRRICISAITWCPWTDCRNSSDSRVGGLVKGPVVFRSFSPSPSPFPPSCVLASRYQVGSSLPDYCADSCSEWIVRCKISLELLSLSSNVRLLLKWRMGLIWNTFIPSLFSILGGFFWKSSDLSSSSTTFESSSQYHAILRHVLGRPMAVASIQWFASEAESSLTHNCHTLVAPCSALYLDGWHMDQEDFLKWSPHGAQAPGK